MEYSHKKCSKSTKEKNSTDTNLEPLMHKSSTKKCDTTNTKCSVSDDDYKIEDQDDETIENPEESEGLNVQKNNELTKIAAAVYNIAQLYSKGAVFEKNEVKAAQFYLKAAKMGYAPAMYEIGIWLRNCANKYKDYFKKINCKEEYDDELISENSNLLLDLDDHDIDFLDSIFQNYNYTCGEEWLYLAEEKKYLPALIEFNYYDHFYIFKEDIFTDYEYQHPETLFCESRGASAEVLFDLAECYLLQDDEDDTYLDENYSDDNIEYSTAMFFCYLLSAQHGHAEAFKKLEQLFKNKKIAKDFPNERIQWLELCLENDENNVELLKELADYYHNNDSVQVDYAKALDYYAKASELGDQEATDSFAQLKNIVLRDYNNIHKMKL